MFKLLLPDHDFETFDLITPEFLKSIGKKYLLCDLDNTLVAYDVAEPDEKVANWVRRMTESGIKLVIISNNEKDRVESFCKDLGTPFLYKAGKPSKKTVRNALALVGGNREECAVAGDQLLTDVVTARISKVTPIWVKTIKRVDRPFFRFKDAVEKPFKKYYFKHKKTEKK